jgi:hypothetical protein
MLTKDHRAFVSSANKALHGINILKLGLRELEDLITPETTEDVEAWILLKRNANCIEMLLHVLHIKEERKTMM